MAGNLVGWSYIASKEYDMALEYLFDALEKDDKIAAIHLNIGLAYKAQEEYEDALTYFENAIELDEGSIGSRAKAEIVRIEQLREE